MVYSLGVGLAIFAGLTNFLGQIIQKKAINNIKLIQDDVSILDLIKNPLWIFGLLLIVVFSTICLTIAQYYIGPALIPGLFASGLIVLAIGSSKILGVKLNKKEIMAIILIIIGVILITLSRLSIEGDVLRFNDSSFVTRVVVATVILFIIWNALYYGGRRTKHKLILMSLGAGFPFFIANIWHQPFVLFFKSMSEVNTSIYIIWFIISAIILSYVNIMGMIHLQKALAEGNASIVIPMAQIPQQIAPVFIYIIIYALSAPNILSYFYLFSGIILITVAGFILGKCQGIAHKAIV